MSYYNRTSNIHDLRRIINIVDEKNDICPNTSYSTLIDNYLFAFHTYNIDYWTREYLEKYYTRPHLNSIEFTSYSESIYKFPKLRNYEFVKLYSYFGRNF